jgi:hypothetical protein
VDIVEGVAGSGKTTALAAAADAWGICGYRVHGCSLAARAAVRLEDATGIPSSTLDGLLGQLDRRELVLTARDVVVVDEAAMVGTRKLHALFDHADRAGAKVVLIGDPRQLPEIDAGGAFGALERTLGGPVLSTNRRQDHEWERTALQQLRAGDTDAALDAYRAHGRIHDHDDARTVMIDDWMHARAVGEDVVMLAPTVAAVEDLNRRARHQLQAVGALRPDRVELGDRRFTPGDEVLALRNAYDLGVLNGNRYTVQHVDTRRHQLHCAGSTGRLVAIPFAYADAGHLSHAYAMTIHKAQGATVERALVLADETLAAEHAYTALSRASRRTDVYVDTRDLDVEAHAPVLDPPVRDRLAASVARSVAQHLAIDQTLVPLLPVEALRGERDRLRQQLADRPVDHSIDLRRLADRIRSTRQSLEHAHWRQDNAQQRLDQLGPMGRRLHRRDRLDIEHLACTAAADIEQLTAELGSLTTHHRELTNSQCQLQHWDHQHAPELARLDDLDRSIRKRDVVARAIQVDSPTRSQGIERGLHLGL